MCEEISMVLFGRAGQGKSSIANMLIQGDIYQKAMCSKLMMALLVKQFQDRSPIQTTENNIARVTYIMPVAGTAYQLISSDFNDFTDWAPDTPTVDNTEWVYISSLALLKMLKHGRAEVPMEVMGLMLGVSIEAVDPKNVGYVEAIWTTRNGGKVVTDAFRLINPQMLMLGQEPRQTTSKIGHLNKPSIQALIHYYSIAINYRKNKNVAQLAQKNLDPWIDAAKLYGTQRDQWKEFFFFDLLMKKFQTMLTLAESYNKSVQEESTITPEQLKTRHVGKQVPKRHLEESVEDVMSNNI
ncbi:11998_t:CDS:10, partial [Funneliformis mosseae]